MFPHPPLPSFGTPAIANHLLDVDLGYAEEAALLAEMKALKARAAAHCAKADRRKFTTQTTTLLRDIVQHLPENPMQVPGARSLILMNLVGRVPGNVPALMPLMPLTPARAPCQNDRGVPPGSSSLESLRVPKAYTLVHGDQYVLPYSPTAPTAVQSVPPSTRGLFIAHPAGESSSSVPRVIYGPRGQKRVREDEWHDSPRARASPGCYTPDGRSMDGLGNTPDASPEVAYTSTPHGPAFIFGPPDTPSPLSSARKSTGSAYLSGSFRARRSLPHRGTRASAVLPSGPLGLEEDEIPRFLGGL